MTRCSFAQLAQLPQLAAMILAFPALASAQGPASGTITIGKVDSVWSSTLNEQRRYLVYTPPSYRDTTYLPRNYPVLYLLDGDAHFHSVTGLLQILGTGVNATFVVPEMIVVAIPNTNRMRDLTPTRVERNFEGKPDPSMASTGGGTNFLSFLKRELIPRIDSAYRTAPYRVFVGHSLGGLMAFQALYTIPETFNAYVAIDPSLWWDNRRLVKDGIDYFAKPALPGRALFMGQANTLVATDTTDNAHFNSMLRINRLMETSNKSGVRYGYKYYPDDDHGSVSLIAEYDALHFIFEGYKPDLFRALESPAYVSDHFEDVSRRLGYRVLPPESMVDLMAQVEMGRDKLKAMALLQLNAANYAKSPHALVALADVLLASGDSAGARAQYERAIVVAPAHSRARSALLKLSGGK